MSTTPTTPKGCRTREVEALTRPRACFPHWTLVVAWLCACSAETGLEPCDIREIACQDEVFYAVQRARGAAWDPWTDRAPMRVISESQFSSEQRRLWLEAELEEQEHDHFESALELLRLLDPGRAADASADAIIDNTVAYYSAADKAVTIVDRELEADVERATQTLAHELVHAAQDREIGFSSIRAGSLDEAYAQAGLIEGEASFLDQLVMLESHGAELDDVDWDRSCGSETLP